MGVLTGDSHGTGGTGRYRSARRRNLRIRTLGALAAALLVASGCGSREGDKLDALAQRQAEQADLAAGSREPAAEPVEGAPVAEDGAVPATPDGTATAAAQAAPTGAPSAQASATGSGAGSGGSGAAQAGKAASQEATSGGGQAAPRAGAQAPGTRAGGGTSGGAVPAPPGQPGPAAPGPAGKKSEILFGSFGVASGVVGSVFDALPTATRAWVAHINSKGGLNGHPVKLILADDGGDSARTQQIVRRMVEQDRVVAFLGEFSGTTAGVLPYLQEKGVPIIGSYGADGAAEGHPMYFNPGHGPRLGKSWGFLGTILTFTEKKKLGILYCREVQECSVQVSNFKKLLPYQGIDLVYESQVSLAQPDYTGEMLAAQRAGADVLALLVDWATVARMKKAAGRQGYDPVLAGMHQLHDSDVGPFAKDVEGAIVYGQTGNWQTSPKLADYRDAVARYQPNKPLGDSGALQWVAGRLLAEKVAPLLQEPVTSAQILTGLRSIQNETLDGLLPGLNWSQGADKGVHYCVVPAKFAGGKFVTHDAAESFVCPKK